MSKKLMILGMGVMILFISACVTNPITGKDELMLFGESDDVAMGKKYAPDVEKELGGRIENPVLQNYIDSVGQKAARVSQKPNFEYHYVALNDKMINAFALPGGPIFITSCLLKKLNSEAQLASVLAHETAHVVARHTMHSLSKELGFELVLSAVTTDKSSQAAVTVAKLTNQIISLRYSRDDEKIADLAGLDYMVKAGYNPNGMAETMQMLQEQSKSGSIEFLSTHPNPENRVGYIKDRIASRYPQSGNLLVGKEAYVRNALEQLR
jgi:predicted Zn-dependent protease